MWILVGRFIGRLSGRGKRSRVGTEISVSTSIRNSDREAKHKPLAQVPEQDRGPENVNFDCTSHEDLDGLGRSHHGRFRNLGKLDDIKKAIEYFARALELTPDGHPDLSCRHTNLGVSYADRFQRLDNLEDLKKSTEHFSHALALTPDDHPVLSQRYADLGAAYSDLFRRLDDLNDLEKAIDYASHALSLTPDGQPDLSPRYTNLGVSYVLRFRRLGSLDDLGKAIEYFSLALKTIPDGHPELAQWHANLAATYGDRFQYLDDIDDLERSIEHDSHALALTPDGDPDLQYRYGNLGMSHTDRFERLGELKDLERSIEHKSRALALTPDDHPNLPRRYASLGLSYNHRFRRLDELGDAEKAIECHSRALALTPKDHPILSQRHADLGVSYGDRFQRLGSLNDLEKSIEYSSHALTSTPDGHPDLPQRHAHLGVSYGDRFNRLGDPDDLERSIEYYSRALELTPEGHPNLPRRYTSLGLSYNHRFRRLGALDDLEKSIEHFSHALALTTDGHPDLPRRYADLGVSYSNRFRRLGDLEGLGKSIEYASHALALTPGGHPDLSLRHADLGVSYSDRFQRLKDPNDLEKSIEHAAHALTLTPEGHPDLHNRHFNQAQLFCIQYECTSDSTYLGRSLDSFRRASQLLAGSPRDRFRYALRWAELASKYSSLSPIEAYQTAIDLLPQFIWLGASTTQRYQDLPMTENLAINAASAAILHADHRLAIEWLEHARCVVWNQSLMLRSPLDQLQSSHPELATRLQVVTQQLQDTSFEPPASPTRSSRVITPDQIARQRHKLAREFNHLLSQARMLPGFEEFLQPMRSNHLVCAAKHGPTVVINCHMDRCDALIILPGKDDIKHLPLHKFTAEEARRACSKIEASLKCKGLRERGLKFRQKPGHKVDMASVLLTLWKEIVQPVLDFLGYLDNASVNGLPHITWCPTGPLSFLPLHAAGDYNKPQSRVFDYVISSYTPTLTALLASAPSPLYRSSRLLAIGQENTPGRSSLPGTTRELACVRAHTQNKAKYSQLTGDQATTAAVLDAMEQHDWVHLACHAHQNVDDPTKSGFYLHDGTLDLASINLRSFKNKGLAFLSACQTAAGDDNLPDEAIHLASGMLVAGYSSVIATMWSVVDSDAPFVADKVYAELMRDGKMGNGEAGKALHNAVAELREKVGEKEFGRWVPYIHIGS